MELNITYLLGAGASAHTIPIVRDMNYRIREIVEYIKYYEGNLALKEENEKLYDSILRSIDNSKIVEDLLWLLGEVEKYFSIDTLARKYYLIDDDISYERLKKCLIFYFTLEQLIFIPSNNSNPSYSFYKENIDKRYDSFLSTILSKSKELQINGSIKVISWNYDIQFELSLKRFVNKTIQQIKKKYQIFPNFYDRNSTIELDNDQFSLLKLNGNALFNNGASNYNKDEYYTAFDNNILDFEALKVEEKLGKLLENWSEIDFSNNSSIRYLNFAWDGEKEFKGRKHEAHADMLKKASEIASQTDILVVIGYSFPIFNRTVDNVLFSNMNRLRKVYIQDPQPERIKSTMTNAFKLLQRTNITGHNIFEKNNIENPIVEFLLETSTNQFLLPYELYQEPEILQ